MVLIKRDYQMWFVEEVIIGDSSRNCGDRTEWNPESIETELGLGAPERVGNCNWCGLSQSPEEPSSHFSKCK